MRKVLRKKPTEGQSESFLTWFSDTGWCGTSKKDREDVLVFTSQFAIDMALMRLSDDHNLSDEWEAVDA